MDIASLPVEYDRGVLGSKYRLVVIAAQRARELARDADLRIRPPKGAFGPSGGEGRTAVHSFTPSDDFRLPPPGTILTREYQGKKVCVTVLENGFEYEDKVYRSLTAIANVVTGSHWNGFGFFGLLATRGMK